MKYLRNKLLLFISLLLIFTVIFLTTISSILYYRSSMAEAEQILSGSSISAGDRFRLKYLPQ